MAVDVVKLLNPEVVKQIARLDLKAKFIVEGFYAGLHTSPFLGFSVEFSEHRKYEPGDDIQTIDWAVYARTDKYYVKKFEAETNVQCFLVVDTSPSMNYRTVSELTKMEYSISLAAALGYLMIRQADPVGLITFSDCVKSFIPPRTKRNHFYSILKVLALAKPSGQTDLANSLYQIATLVKRRSIITIFSDFLQEPDLFLPCLHRLSYRGHDIIAFHILDHAEVSFPFEGYFYFKDLETGEGIMTDSFSIRQVYLEELNKFTGRVQESCGRANVEYMLLDTATPFDRALMMFLLKRGKKG